MAYIQEIRMTQRSNGPATILAIGTANPPDEMYQSEYPEFYFRITNSEHLANLKAKFKRICEKTMIRKRHMHVTEELLKGNPEMSDCNASSLKARQSILNTEVPMLGYEAAIKAIKEWGKPKSMITHVIFSTNSDVDLPGADYRLVKLLSLQPSVNRLFLRQGGCQSGGTVLRIAKDIAENNCGARVLVICSESSVIWFNVPSEANLLQHALFGDGAGALIIGSDPDNSTERPLFRVMAARQTTLPDTDGALHTSISEMGLVGKITPKIPKIISKNIETTLMESFNQVGINDWNSMFWVTHPGGRAILDQIEAELGLEKSKLRASRHVLSEFGNLSSASVIFIFDEMRKRSLKEGKTTTGEGLDWGVLHGFGPGLTIETIVLHSVPLITE